MLEVFAGVFYACNYNKDFRKRGFKPRAVPEILRDRVGDALFVCKRQVEQLVEILKTLGIVRRSFAQESLPRRCLNAYIGRDSGHDHGADPL